MRAWPSPFILMVDRGGCTFVKKVFFVVVRTVLLVVVRSGTTNIPPFVFNFFW
jgi:hypothetical protein